MPYIATLFPGAPVAERSGRPLGLAIEPRSETMALRVSGNRIPVNAMGVYEAEVEIKVPQNGRWIPKKAPSTFFPQTWSRSRVLQEIREAYNARTISGCTYWEGVSSSGMTIGGFHQGTGNAHTITIGPDRVRIENVYTNERPPCELSLQQMRAILIDWIRFIESGQGRSN